MEYHDGIIEWQGGGLGDIPTELLKQYVIDLNCEIYHRSKALNISSVGVRSEQLFCENVIHHTCKHFDTYNGCMGCLVKNYEAK